MRRVVVTGGTGFIGRHLVRSLVRDGIEVHVPTRAVSARRPELPPATHLHAFANPSVEVADLLEQVRPDTVFHLATYFVAQHRPHELAAMIDSNVTFGTVVAQSATDLGATLVHTSSAWQHFGGAAYDPVSLYAATKQALVDVIAYYELVAGLDARDVCLFDTYGPDDDRRKLVDALLRSAATGAPLSMSSGRQLVDLTHVDDVVAALRTAATSGRPGGRYGARSGAPRTVRDLVDVVRAITGRDLDVTWDARPDRPREMVTDWQMPFDEYGWAPQVALVDGLRDLWSEYQEVEA